MIDYMGIICRKKETRIATKCPLINMNTFSSFYQELENSSAVGTDKIIWELHDWLLWELYIERKKRELPRTAH